MKFLLIMKESDIMGVVIEAMAKKKGRVAFSQSHCRPKVPAKNATHGR
ncbi:MAG TPA: hypothetical protein VKC66_01180 [Xanthobacteraceae bacterium]|nr:hypothetical protein [Xanthobacteraceae bacterium]